MPSPLRALSLLVGVTLAALPLALAGCGKQGHGAPQGGSTVTPAKAKLKRKVELAQASQEKMTSTVDTVGYLDAEGQTDVAAGVSGIVEQVYFREGDWVEKDQTLLVRIEPKKYEAMLAHAEANLKRAEAYVILGVQFNSFVHPATVLLAVPFGVTGALGVLWICGDTLNLMSMIGMVLLAGLVKKNSIILVDYTNQLRVQGRGLEEAVLEACPVRLRPIIMTSLACIASAIPLALGYGPGAETRAPLARSIIGGMFLSTLVTLVIVPVFYVLFDRFGAYVARLARREPKQVTHEPPPPVIVVPAPEVAVNAGAVKEAQLELALPLRVEPAG